MKLEHIGLCVEKPLSMAEWWVANLGFKYKLKLGTDNDGVAFISDDDNTIIEFGKLTEVESINLEEIKFIQIHFAIECESPVDFANHLVGKGARHIGESPRNSYKNEKVIIKDPWGTYIQLVNRSEKVK